MFNNESNFYGRCQEMSRAATSFKPPVKGYNRWGWNVDYLESDEKAKILEDIIKWALQDSNNQQLANIYIGISRHSSELCN